MDFVLFLAGMLGALLTVYLAKQEIIPEFRPLFDTSEKEKEAKEHREHIKKTEKHIDEIQAKLESESLPEKDVDRLKTVLLTSQEELREERKRLRELELEIKQSQIISRGLGFLLYIVLGGIFGSLLADKVQVEGLSGNLPDIFKSMVIGATWISYSSIIGLPTRVSKFRREVDEKIDAVKKEVIEMMKKEAERRGQTPSMDVMTTITERFDLVKMEVQKDVKMIL